ncbi:MAG: DUF4097 family beta strand repeat protein [Myxococcales bacterium]|nr:DUF4097 family beta strand repeat protein [Myxococcales bacterium]
MNTHPSVQDLEALLSGTLSEDQSIVISAHTDECGQCGRELAWLHAEKELFAQRARGVPPSQVWAQIEQQIAARVARKEATPKGLRRLLQQTFHDQKAQWFAVGAAAVAIFGIVAASPLSPLHKGQWFSAKKTQPDIVAMPPAGSDHDADDADDASDADSAAHDDAVTASTKLTDPISLEIVTTAAEVELSESSGNEAKLTLTEGVVRTAQFVAPSAGQSLWQLQFDGRSVLQDGHLLLQLPVGSKVKVKTTSGDIHASGLLADIDITTSSGDISIKGSQAVTVQSTSGDVRLEAVRGEVNVNTVSGELLLQNEVLRPVRFHSTSGDLTIADGCKVADCKISAETISGNVLVKSLASSSFVAKLTSQSGEITGSDRLPVEMKRHPGQRTEWTAKVGSGTGMVSLESMSGDILLE